MTPQKFDRARRIARRRRHELPRQIYVPRDSAALAVGADEVAAASQAECARRGLALELVRNGSRGLFWLEPLVEVDTPHGRIAYGPVTPDDVPALFDAGLLDGGAHPLCQGPTEAIPYLAKQERLTFARIGITDPLSLADYEAHDGWAGLRRALTLDGAAIVQEVTTRACAAAAARRFPPASSGRRCCGTDAAQKYVVCNADEGDSGTFSDRMMMEGDPYVLIEGMTIAGLAVGATQGYVYVRSEYPHCGRDAERSHRARHGRRLSRRRRAAARAAPSISRCARPPAPTSAARRRRCSRASKASAASCAPSRRCRRSRVCSASRR